MAVEFKSSSMKMYSTSEFKSTKAGMAPISDADLAKLDEWYKWAEAHYSEGGHGVVEAYEPWELLKRCDTLDAVKELCGLIEEKCEDARNA